MYRRGVATVALLRRPGQTTKLEKVELWELQYKMSNLLIDGLNISFANISPYKSSVRALGVLNNVTQAHTFNKGGYNKQA